ncbi:hypothetical protein [Candidatus Cetobacterium colombiensis]|uniref:Uncharacterized protein n=1 Tax=Candidatus Cetobacterium colombiensis TaxID=3073100 RepID=A0ABU4WBW4_9FUSO|nr:hypothetical protein [Candidatus Cetobacterium colombiensis]MDX8336174.1 hypothetical protein [Candidatus Cetobacterium colombiensis]
MNDILIKISKKYRENLQGQRPEDKESNIIYGKILNLLEKDPTLNLFGLLTELNKGKTFYEKNKVRNRRDRLTNLDILIKNANTIVDNLLEEDEESLRKVERSLNRGDIYRDRMAMNILLTEFPSPEFHDVYYTIKNDQCKKFLLELVEEIRNSK